MCQIQATDVKIISVVGGMITRPVSEWNEMKAHIIALTQKVAELEKENKNFLVIFEQQSKQITDLRKQNENLTKQLADIHKQLTEKK